tara:strand:+ start:579 stop:1505 length:927 start_codon:yes stop_codon:yes gene_type:complete
MYNFENIKISDLKKYMLYNTNIIESKDSTQSKDIPQSKDITQSKNVNKIDNINSLQDNKKLKKLASIDYNKMQRKYNEKKKLFYEDKLFWCFYKLYKNMEDDDMENLNIMKEEKDFKINIVNKIHNNKEIKDMLKKYKFKKNNVEDELLNSKNISINTFECLIMLHKMNVFVIKSNNTYTYFNYDNIFQEDDDNNNNNNNNNDNNVNNDNNYKKFINYKFVRFDYNSTSNKLEINIEENISNLFISNILDNYYYLENLDKPIKAFSSYKLDELINICNKLKINVYNVYNVSKKKTKKEMYEEIYKLLN